MGTDVYVKDVKSDKFWIRLSSQRIRVEERSLFFFLVVWILVG